MTRRLPLSLILLLALCCSAHAATYTYFIQTGFTAPGFTRDESIKALKLGCEDFERVSGHKMVQTSGTPSVYFVVGSVPAGAAASYDPRTRVATLSKNINWAKSPYSIEEVRNFPLHECCHAILGYPSNEAGHREIQRLRKFAYDNRPVEPKPEPPPVDPPKPDPIPPPPKPDPKPEPVPKDALWEAVRDRMREENGGKGVKAADINAAVRHLNAYIKDWKKGQK